jgi:hypothetical protein
MKISPDNQQSPKIKSRAIFGPTDVAGDGALLWWTYTGTKLETVDTAKETPNLTGHSSPLQ